VIELSHESSLMGPDWALYDAWSAVREPSSVTAAVEGRLAAARASGVVAVAHEGGAPLGVVGVRESPWDAEGLGGPVATVDLLAVTKGCPVRQVTERLTDAVDQFSRDRGTIFDWLRQDERDAWTQVVLLQRGFEVRGCVLSLIAPTDRLAEPARVESGVSVRPASEADLPWVSRLAADAFSQSRFRDPRGPADWHRQVYARWVASRFAQRSDDLHVLVARHEDEPAGFLIWKVHTSPAVAGRVGQVDLVAVDPRARRLGVGRALFDEARRRSGPLAWIAADVYNDNPSGLALHQRYGLEVAAASFYLHRWNAAP